MKLLSRLRAKRISRQKIKKALDEANKGKTKFLGYYYSKECTVPMFDVNKYEKRMPLDKVMFVYDIYGRILGVISEKTDKIAEQACRKYIIKKKFRIIRLQHFINDFTSIFK